MPFSLDIAIRFIPLYPKHTILFPMRLFLYPQCVRFMALAEQKSIEFRAVCQYANSFAATGPCRTGAQHRYSNRDSPDARGF